MAAYFVFFEILHFEIKTHIVFDPNPHITRLASPINTHFTDVLYTHIDLAELSLPAFHLAIYRIAKKL